MADSGEAVERAPGGLYPPATVEAAKAAGIIAARPVRAQVPVPRAAIRELRRAWGAFIESEAEYDRLGRAVMGVIYSRRGRREDEEPTR